MSVLGRLLGGQQNKALQLTEKGKDKIENPEGELAIRYRIASDIDEHPASRVSQIAERTQIAESVVRKSCLRMLKDGWLTRVTPED